MYIMDALAAIREGSVAILEAPTGFGKTVCNLLALLNYDSNKTYFYLTRTIEQGKIVSNTVKEINRENRNKLTSSIQLASRKTLCHLNDIKEDDIEETYKSCRTMLKNYHPGCIPSNTLPIVIDTDKIMKEINSGKIRGKLTSEKETLRYFKHYKSDNTNLYDFFDDDDEYEEDYEDGSEDANGNHEKALKKLKIYPRSCCAYLSAKKLFGKRTINIGTYSYILNPNIASLIIENKIKVTSVIIDEGHNIEDALISIEERTLVVSNFDRIILDLNSIKSEIRSDDKNYNLKVKLVDDIIIKSESFETSLKQINTRLFTINLRKNKFSNKHGKENEAIMYVTAFVEKIKTYQLEQLANDIFSIYKDLDKEYEEFKENRKKQKSKVYTKTFFDFIIQMIEYKKDNNSVVIFENTRETHDNKNKFKVILRPLIPTRPIQKLLEITNSVIICSGSLRPKRSWLHIFGSNYENIIERGYKLSLQEKNILLMTTDINAKGESLSCNRDHKRDNDYEVAYRSAIEDLITKTNLTSCGVLIFTPSYKMLDELNLKHEYIDDKGYKIKVIATLKDKKEEFDDEFGSIEMSLINKFKDNIKQGNKTVLLTVMKGKYAEGFDFKDDLARMIIIAGTPFMQFDKYTRMKKEHLTKKFNDKIPDYGGLWYNVNSSRTFTQTFGRGWRSEEDWCIGVHLDAASRHNLIKKYSSPMIQNNFSRLKNFDLMIRKINSFLQNK